MISATWITISFADVRAIWRKIDGLSFHAANNRTTAIFTS